MKKKIPLLAGVLSVQLIVALLFLILGNGDSKELVSEPLLGIYKDKIERIEISDSDKQVTMSKSGDGWHLSESGLPVEQSKLTSLLGTLEELKTTWPVATTSSSHERFEVSNSKHQRKLTLSKGGEPLAELYVGTSPGFKKSHVRLAGQDEVYAVEFNTYDAPVTEKDWLDKTLLAVKSVTKITGKDYDLTKDSDSWSLSVVPEGREINQEKVSDLAKAIGAFRVMDIVEYVPELDDDKRATLNVSNSDNYSLVLFEKDGKYYVKRSDIETYFTLSKYEYDRLTKSNLESLTTEVTVDGAVAKSNTEDVTLEVEEKEEPK